MTKRAVIITSSIFAGIIMIVTILFGAVFRVRDIKLNYNAEFYYKDQVSDILSVSKLKKNISIFEINQDKIIKNIESNYPYARVEGINLTSFTSVNIKLSNRAPLYYFTENEICYILDEDSKVLETVTTEEYNNKNYQFIDLKNVFSASENIQVGQFLDGRYSNILKDLYNSLYSNAMIEVDNGNGEFEAKYLEREDMLQIINGIQFIQEYELNGKVDKLVINTSFGVKMSIIEPQKDLDNKINRAFSAFRALQAGDRENSTTLIQSGEINIDYSYDDNRNTTLICEYRAQ